MEVLEFEKQLVSMAKGLTVAERGIICAPEIDLDIKKLTPGLDKHEVIFVANAAAIPGEEKATSGFACTADRFYYCNKPGKEGQFDSFLFADVARVGVNGNSRSGRFSFGDSIEVVLKNGSSHTLTYCLTGCNLDAVQNLLIFAANNVPETIEDQERLTYSVSDLPQEQLMAYMEIIYNYAYLEDCQVDSEEYAVLQNLGVRLGLETEVRNSLRDYTFLLKSGEHTKTGILLKQCTHAISYGSYELLRFSLMQDCLYLHEATHSGQEWTEDAFLNSLQKFAQITDPQVKLMLTAIALHKETAAKDADLQKIQGKMNKLRKDAKDLHIPREALYCSGSIYSIDCYHGLRRLIKQGQSITRQRELMLQECLRNSQVSTNRLVADMNDLTMRLLEEVQRGNQQDEKVQRLSQLIQQYQRQAVSMLQRQKDLSDAELRNRVPNRLYWSQMDALSGGTKDFVMSCYTLIQGEYLLREDITQGELRRLSRIEELVDDE